MYSGTPFDIRKIYSSSSTLSACNNLLVRYKVYSSDPRECYRTKAEGMVKLVGLLGENYTEIKV